MASRPFAILRYRWINTLYRDEFPKYCLSEFRHAKLRIRTGFVDWGVIQGEDCVLCYCNRAGAAGVTLAILYEFLQRRCCGKIPFPTEPAGAITICDRDNARQKVFFTDDDRELFLTTLAGVVSHYGWIYHAYCLMANHYQLLTETPKANLPIRMCRLDGIDPKL